MLERWKNSSAGRGLRTPNTSITGERSLDFEGEGTVLHKGQFIKGPHGHSLGGRAWAPDISLRSGVFGSGWALLDTFATR